MATYKLWVLHSPYSDKSWRGIEKCWGHNWTQTPELFEAKEHAEIAEIAASGLGITSKGFVPVEVELKVPDVREKI